MKPKPACPLAQVASCREVPDHHDPVERTDAPLRLGQVLDGRFLIKEIISRSGMATIFQAEDQQNANAPVAVKVPHLHYESDPAFYSRFQREEEIGRKLDHPSILKYMPVDGPRSRPYLVTEYLKGCTLAHLLKATKPLPEHDALKIAGLVCEALEHMHQRGIIHRDLKPDNIMICCDGTIRIMDFGIARAAGCKLTLVGFTPAMGTPDYMAPEQVKGKPGDARTDLYNLGALLYEMLTGVTPFENENPWVSMNLRVTGDPPAPRKLNPQLSSPAEEIVLRALQRDPADRYQTAAAMKTDLDAPDKVSVTGLCNRLHPATAPRLDYEQMALVKGGLLALAVISTLVVMFFVLTHLLAKS